MSESVAWQVEIRFVGDAPHLLRVHILATDGSTAFMCGHYHQDYSSATACGMNAREIFKALSPAPAAAPAGCGIDHAELDIRIASLCGALENEKQYRRETEAELDMLKSADRGMITSAELDRRCACRFKIGKYGETLAELNGPPCSFHAAPLPDLAAALEKARDRGWEVHPSVHTDGWRDTWELHARLKDSKERRVINGATTAEAAAWLAALGKEKG